MAIDDIIGKIFYLRFICKFSHNIFDFTGSGDEEMNKMAQLSENFGIEMYFQN